MLMVNCRGATGADGALGARGVALGDGRVVAVTVARGLALAVELEAVKPVLADKIRTRAANVKKLIRMTIFGQPSCDGGPPLSNGGPCTVPPFAISLSAQSWTLTQAANSATPDSDLLIPVCALASTLPLFRSILAISPEKKLVANTCVVVTGSDIDAQPKAASG